MNDKDVKKRGRNKSLALRAGLTAGGQHLTRLPPPPPPLPGKGPLFPAPAIATLSTSGSTKPPPNMVPFAAAHTKSGGQMGWSRPR